MKFIHCVILSALLASPAFAALEQDLGQGLSYLRVVDLATDLPIVQKSLHDKNALILDFRSVEGSGDKVTELARALEKSSGPRQIRFVLISATTSPTIIEVVSSEHSGVLTFGPRTPALTPDIAVPINSDDDRHAYEAFGGGTPLDKLLNNTLDKRRFDEAALLKERATGLTPASETGPDDDSGALSPEASDLHPSASTEGKPPKKLEPTPLVDAVLQRAVQLHRTLLALKKL